MKTTCDLFFFSTVRPCVRNVQHGTRVHPHPSAHRLSFFASFATSFPILESAFFSPAFWHFAHAAFPPPAAALFALFALRFCLRAARFIFRAALFFRRAIRRIFLAFFLIALPFFFSARAFFMRASAFFASAVGWDGGVEWSGVGWDETGWKNGEW